CGERQGRGARRVFLLETGFRIDSHGRMGDQCAAQPQRCVTMTSKDRRILIFGSLIAGILLVAGAFWLSPGRADPFAVCRKGTVSGDFGGLGGSFELTDQNGQRVSDGQVLAEPALLYFGYTYCP